MSSKQYILQNVKRNISQRLDKPEIKIEAITYKDKIQQFIDINKSVGGDARILKTGENINSLIKELYPKAKNIASNLPEISIATFNEDEIEDPHQLKDTNLAIVKGEIGVAENGSVWIPQNVVHKAIYFISEYLVIVLDRNKIVNNMHEAYARVDMNELGFGVFISGPSKTADIEQALVVGAHGAKGVTVIIT